MSLGWAFSVFLFFGLCRFGFVCGVFFTPEAFLVLAEFLVEFDRAVVAIFGKYRCRHTNSQYTDEKRLGQSHFQKLQGFGSQWIVRFSIPLKLKEASLTTT
ncbi:hypothetical protein HW11_22015 [Pseudomonas aeruginosa]|nr:hypothetical protein HW11_22015 [Pseudomonas aeruginosa]